MKFLQTKPQVKNMNINYNDLYYTVIETRDENKVVDDKYGIDYSSFNDIITPNVWNRMLELNRVRWY